MKLGLLTAPFPETPLADVVDWTAANGFESIEIACWPQHLRPDPPVRRYVPHRRREPVGRRGHGAAREIEARGLHISGLGYYPNPLHPDPAHRDEVIGHLKHVIVAAEKMDVRLVNTFMGADAAKNRTRTGTRPCGSGPTSSRSPRQRRQLTIENCPMLFSLRRVAGRPQHRHVAAIWRRIFEQWSGTVGLNFDPSHLFWQLIDSRGSSASSGRTSCTSRPRT